MVDMSDTAACAAKREGRAEPGDHVDFCRQSSMDDSYLVVNHPNSIPEAASVRRKAPAKPLRLQQHLTTSSLRVKWVEYQPDSASSDGDLVASVVSAVSLNKLQALGDLVEIFWSHDLATLLPNHCYLVCKNLLFKCQYHC